MDAEQVINSVRESFEDYDINIILEQRQFIKNLEDAQEQIKSEYFAMFGEETLI